MIKGLKCNHTRNKKATKSKAYMPIKSGKMKRQRREPSSSSESASSSTDSNSSMSSSSSDEDEEKTWHMTKSEYITVFEWYRTSV